MIRGLKALSVAFHNQFDKDILVNDISLQGGGIFDLNEDWLPPHQTHREGRNADLNYEEQSESERTYFKSTAESLGFNVQKHRDSKTGRYHWHITK